MKQSNVLPNVITAFGLACGLFLIFKVNMVDPGYLPYNLLFTSTMLILIAAFADVIDGATARMLGAESEFGVMFDSLADAVSFGVAPSVLLLKVLSLEQGSPLSFFAFVAAMVYSISGILRLVRFNVKASQIKGDELAMQAYKKNFTGLPIPAAACAVISLNLLLHSPLFVSRYTLEDFTKTIILGSAYIFIGILMISKFKFMSIKALRFKMESFYLIFSTVILAIFILYGIIHQFALVLAVLTWGYVFLGCFLTLLRLIALKRSKALEDFDPSEEENG